jgi:hypothetical protein
LENDDCRGWDHFGWENFTLSNPKSKMDYLAAQVMSTMSHRLGEEVAQNIAVELSGMSPEQVESIEWSNFSVDHESVWSLPRPLSGEEVEYEGVHMGFLQELTDWLKNDRVVVLGGNDNSDGHPDQDAGENAGEMFGWRWRGSYVRKDPVHGYWTVYNPESGAKMQFSFDVLGHSIDPDRASLPELVDLKITDYCTFDCSFCYQGSTKEGKHAKLERLDVLAEALKRMKIFEVAIGGGEPTLHPDFINILKAFKDRGISANFTTRNLSYVVSNAEALKEWGTSFAYSIDNLDQFEKYLAATKDGRIPIKSTVQIVMGTWSKEDLLTLFEKSSWKNVTLLGYKTTGRGSDYTFDASYESARYADEILEAAREHSVRLAIDTALAEQWSDFLDGLGIDKMLYREREGTHSMYIDAVTGQMGPSSYCPEEQMAAIPALGGGGVSVDGMISDYQAYADLPA